MKNEKALLLIAYLLLAAFSMFGCGNKPAPAEKYYPPITIHNDTDITVSGTGTISDVQVDTGLVVTQDRPDTSRVILKIIWKDRKGTHWYEPGFIVNNEFRREKYKKLPKHWLVIDYYFENMPIFKVWDK